jgi:hypothetical protein
MEARLLLLQPSVAGRWTCGGWRHALMQVRYCSGTYGTEALWMLLLWLGFFCVRQLSLYATDVVWGVVGIAI